MLFLNFSRHFHISSIWICPSIKLLGEIPSSGSFANFTAKSFLDYETLSYSNFWSSTLYKSECFSRNLFLSLSRNLFPSLSLWNSLTKNELPILLNKKLYNYFTTHSLYIYIYTYKSKAKQKISTKAKDPKTNKLKTESKTGFGGLRACLDKQFPQLNSQFP